MHQFYILEFNPHEEHWSNCGSSSVLSAVVKDADSLKLGSTLTPNSFVSLLIVYSVEREEVPPCTPQQLRIHHWTPSDVS